MKMLIVAWIIALLAGCATTPSPAPAAGTQTFTGEVWSWDDRESTVTLVQGGQHIRVKTTPDQVRGLRLHERVRVTGTPAPPADLVVTLGPVGPVNPVPKGQPEVVELKGTVTSADPNGRIAVGSARGPIHLWGAAGADKRFPAGAPVTVWMSVQPVDLVPAATPATPAPAPVTAPAASPSSEPGDHAVVTGRIIGINPGGVLVVESPTGPIQVLAADGTRYKVGDWILVRTTVRTAA
ncbi:MAG TPA: hypothetical protein VFV05_00780 [Methylomirabilota bacterium]|nr:hypothetical protein [Methylomirabilota bacterium]